MTILPKRLGIRAAVLLSRGIALCAVAFAASARAAESTGPGRTDPNTGLFPDSSIVDFRSTLDAPAGKHGFLRTTPEGHFAWQDGARARFWGVNISNRSVFIAKPEIDRVVDALARSGANMVRLEAIDSVGGLLDVPGQDTSRTLNPERLDTLDYWIARLRERGIYLYVDLLDFRQFKSGDGVPAWDKLGRAARPYAFFDRRLIDLQKEYATQLLQHKNPYTGKSLAEDPALALVEICNENGLFARATSLDDLVEPYGSAFRQLWNQWLLRRYSSRDGIRAAWGTEGGADVLMSFEDPAHYSIQLPLFSPLPPGSSPGPVAVARHASARLRDGVRFLYEVQRGYFREMRDHLRHLGVRAPITAVVTMECVPDLASVAAELDFLAGNVYYDHPTFGAKEWDGDFFVTNQNYLRLSTPYQIAPTMAAMHWAGKPLVIREWATVWPNAYRAAAVPEMVGYAGLQDIDGALLFGYQTAPRPETLGDFDHQADPAVWGLFALGSLAFRRGDVPPAPRALTLNYSPDDVFRWPNGMSDLHRLAWLMRLTSRIGAPGDGPTSRTLASKYAPTYRRVVEKRRVLTRVRVRRHGRPTRRYRTEVEVVRSVRRAPVYPRIPSAPNPLPIFPDDTTARVMDLLNRAHTGLGSRLPDLGVFSGGWGQVARDTARGRLTVAAPKVVAVCGELPRGEKVALGPWVFSTGTPVGAFMALSLDGKPLTVSRHFVVKMVSRAENTDQAIVAAQPGQPGPYVVSKWGRTPIVTFGKPAKNGARVTLRGREVLWLGLVDGCWELEVRDGQATFLCDTSGASGRLFGRPFVTTADIPAVADTRLSSSGGGRSR